MAATKCEASDPATLAGGKRWCHGFAQACFSRMLHFPAPTGLHHLLALRQRNFSEITIDAPPFAANIRALVFNL
jgi:hypothetical protein